MRNEKVVQRCGLYTTIIQPPQVQRTALFVEKESSAGNKGAAHRNMIYKQCQHVQQCYQLKRYYKFASMIRNIIALIILSVLVSSFTGRDKGFNEYTELLKRERQALHSIAGKLYVYDLTGRKDCNKTRIRYLGVVRTKKGKRYKILTSFFVFSASATCHGTSNIKIFDMHNQYIGEYDMGMPENLPDVLRNNKLLYLSNSEDCNLRKINSIDLSYGLPRWFSILCSENGADSYNFSSRS